MEDVNVEDYELCVVCGAVTNELKITDINFRYFYVEGAGQLCKKCYEEIYS